MIATSSNPTIKVRFHHVHVLWSARPAPRHHALAPALAPAPAHLPAAVMHFLTILMSQIFCEKDGYFVPLTNYVLLAYDIAK